jgi:hypothetical protein
LYFRCEQGVFSSILSQDQSQANYHLEIWLQFFRARWLSSHRLLHRTTFLSKSFKERFLKNPQLFSQTIMGKNTN